MVLLLDGAAGGSRHTTDGSYSCRLNSLAVSAGDVGRVRIRVRLPDGGGTMVVAAAVH
jgi:hypothetical protein